MYSRQRISRLAWIVVGLACWGADSNAQGGMGRNRGRAREVQERFGNFFVAVSLPVGEAKDRFDETSFVADAKKEQQLAVLYLANKKGDANAHENFETTLFANEALLVTLRRFRCGVLDMTEHPVTLAAYEKQLPMFLAYDAEGKRVGEVSMRGYKPNSGPLIALLDRAAKGHGKLTNANFVKTYRSFLNKLEVLAGRRTAYEQQKAGLEGGDARDRAKLAKVEKELAELEAEEKQLLEEEKKILEAAAVPERPAGAERLGGRQGRGRRGG